MHLLCTYMFLHCTYILKKYLYVVISVINFCNYIYNYTVDLSLTPQPTLNPTHTTKPVPKLTRITHLNSSKCFAIQYEHNKYIVVKAT